MNNTAEAITAETASIVARRHHGNGPSWLRWHERQRAMGPVTVVVIVKAELSVATFCTFGSEFSSCSGPSHAGGRPALSSST
jgi:hypothetical protein